MIVGLGETGLSYARYLAAAGVAGDTVLALDDAASDDRSHALKRALPGADVAPLSSGIPEAAKAVYVSPGVPLSHPVLQAAKAQQTPLYGDVGMFGELAKAPVIAITGTNGKSTVADLCHRALASISPAARLGGNIGTPCLDILDDAATYYVLEVSSYQLELAPQLNSQVAVVLNLAPDHQDRYPSLQAYYDTKLQIYNRCSSAVINRGIDIPAECYRDSNYRTFGDDHASGDLDFGLRRLKDATEVTFAGEAIFSSRELMLRGEHNLLNVQVVLAICSMLDIDFADVIEAICSYGGLPHRNQVVAKIAGVTYINDSKATNPAAMIAAVNGEANGRNIRLIAGGSSKEADFSEAAAALTGQISSLHLIGESAAAIAQSFSGYELFNDGTLEAALAHSAELAEAGDVVMLSPGCASFDQYRNYGERGNHFQNLVGAML